MQPHDASLRDELHTAAAQAGTVGFSTDHVVEIVRRRRRRLATLVAVAVAGAVLVVLTPVAIASGFRGPQPGGINMSQASREPSVTNESSPVSSAATKVFMCGERLDVGDAAESRAGLTMAISGVRRGADNVGPDITVTFTSTTVMTVISTRPQQFEVLYLRDGIIVGGGPMLNMPGDKSPQIVDLVRYGFAVEPGRPSSHDLGQRDQLCPSLSWRQIWSAPRSYEVVVLQGPVTGQPPEIYMDLPAPGRPLLISRKALPR